MTNARVTAVSFASIAAIIRALSQPRDYELGAAVKLTAASPTVGHGGHGEEGEHVHHQITAQDERSALLCVREREKKQRERRGGR